MCCFIYSGSSSIRQVVAFYSGTQINYILILRVLLNRSGGYTLLRYLDTFYPLLRVLLNTSGGYTLLRNLDTFHPLLRILLNTSSGYTLLRYLDTFHPCTPGPPQYVKWLHFTQVPRYLISLYSGSLSICQVVTLYSGTQIPYILVLRVNTSSGQILLRYLDTLHPCTLGPPQYVKWLDFTQVPRYITSLYSGSSSIRQVVRFYSCTQIHYILVLWVLLNTSSGSFINFFWISSYSTNSFSYSYSFNCNLLIS